MQNQECLEKRALSSGGVVEKMDGEAQCVADLLIFIIFVNGRRGGVEEMKVRGPLVCVMLPACFNIFPIYCFGEKLGRGSGALPTHRTRFQRVRFLPSRLPGKFQLAHFNPALSAF